MGKPIQQSGHSFAVAKHSNLNIVLSEIINKYKDNEVLSDLQDKWLSAHCKSIHESDLDELNQFGITYLSGGILLVIVGAGLSCTIIFAEISFDELRVRQQKRRVMCDDEIDDFDDLWKWDN